MSAVDVRPEDALAALTDPDGPYLIGVRHHAPSLAAAVPALLAAARPDVLLVELPGELQEWVPWLAHEDTVAPVALAAVPEGGASGPAFYPFADFSPELAAVRWAARHGVPVVACDLPLRERGFDGAEGSGGSGLVGALRSRLTGRNGDDLWDRLVEATAPGSPPEAVRRAALLTGWALRADTEGADGGVSEGDLARERWMRKCLAEATSRGERAAVVVGAFHAPALVGGGAVETGSGAVEARDGSVEARDGSVEARDGSVEAGSGAVEAGSGLPGSAPVASPGGWITSLIPYTYALLDERSGYPAGIRDPEWQHRVLAAGGEPAVLEEALVRASVEVCAALRESGHPSGPADAREIVRVAVDLGRLRGLPAAGRGELVEAVQSVLAQGEPYGRGRAVARAMERVLVGERVGRAAPGAPRSGLGPSVETEVAALGLPGPERTVAAARDLRLDPLRSRLDRRREVLLVRLEVCRVPYGERKEVVGTGGGAALTSRWEVRWTPATAAMLTAAGMRGVTAAQAAEGVLRERWRAETEAGGATAAQVLRGLEEAAECGLVELAEERLDEVGEVLPGAGTLSELLAGLGLLDRLRAGHVPGLEGDAGDGPGAREGLAREAAEGRTRDARARRVAKSVAVAEALTAAAVRQVDGLVGSEEVEDARGLLELAHRADELGGIRLGEALARLAGEGSPLMRGAAGGVRVLLGHEEAAGFGERVGSWVDSAVDGPGRAALTGRLTGLFTVAGPLLEAAGASLEPLLERVSTLPDRDFLDRLPALRGGFETLSPAARERLLSVVEERVGGSRVGEAGASAAWVAADLAAREGLRGWGLLPGVVETAPVAAQASALAEIPATEQVPALAEFPATEQGAASAVVTTPAPVDSSAPQPDTAPTAAPTPAPVTVTVGSTEPVRHTDAGADAHADADADTGADANAGTDTDADADSGANAGADADTDADHGVHPPSPRPHLDLSPATRWRLLLGRTGDQLPAHAARLATALDELYGSGRGEGSRGRIGGGGREVAYPGAREWAEELAVLFGAGVREEVLAAAVAAGRSDVVEELDAGQVRPSVELLRTVLRHAGGLPEARIAALRPLVRRLVEELARELATRLRPALHGTVVARPSRRPGGGLDLARTLRANLASARVGADGVVQVIPERPVFRTRARRSADWRLILVTDVSGSMEASTIWAALTASVLAGVPTLETHFLAFSTEVIDLTGHVGDPLSLLLEVSVGGGTHIAAGLRHARELVTVPSRTLVVVVSDFEEGYPLGGLLAEVRALVGAGCHVLGCASLDDAGRPRYSTGVAGQLVAAGMPVAALSPMELARWVGEKIA
ncbi:DUF5682 family protein [Streptomyces sp. NPDC004539]|uniref:vWA domain-containing protein n=1 Tax=Streptomyces sp. NPDC004539 TaxID=3154280 RepID=UPI0033B9D6DB